MKTFIVFVLMQFTFTPLMPAQQGSIHHQHKTIKTFDSQEFGNEQTAGQKCIEQLRIEYLNVDPKTNSFGCVRVEHPSNPQPEHRREGSGGRGRI